jgi:hypothetical protein
VISNPRVRKRRIETLLRRNSGGTLATNAPDRLPAHVIAGLQEAGLEPAEEILLASYLSAADWCLLTSERLIWREGERSHGLAWPEIVRTDAGGAWDLVSTGQRSKDTLEELFVTSVSGARYRVHLEKGKGFFLVWSGIVALSAELDGPGDAR